MSIPMENEYHFGQKRATECRTSEAEQNQHIQGTRNPETRKARSPEFDKSSDIS